MPFRDGRSYRSAKGNGRRDAYGSAEAAVLALEAGVDMLLMPADFKGAYNGVLQAVKSGTLSEARIEESVRRILAVKMGME